MKYAHRAKFNVHVPDIISEHATVV